MRAHRLRIRVILALLAVAVAARPARAQDSAQAPPQDTQLAHVEDQSDSQTAGDSSSGQSSSDDSLTLLPHPDDAGYWISGQANVVFQWHPSFAAKYTGPNSLTPGAQSATTHVLTVFTGFEVTPTTEFFGDIEYATGGGIGHAFGVAGYTNLDSVRTVSGAQLPTTPYLAPLMIRQIIPLTDEKVPEDRDEFHLA